MNKFLILLLLLVSFKLSAQQPGKIIVPSSGYASTPLNPNGDGYTSKTSAGFINNDIAESEIPYKLVTAFIPEPTGDLARGPSGSFSDIVGSIDGSGLYVFNDGTNILFRMRIGGYISGSKGYCVLIDTDQKFGSSGADADPNFIAGTTGVSGNPGFELEVTLETNFRVAVYNVDGTTSPILLSSYPVSSNSIISVAKSTDSNDPDYYFDFYVPITALGLAPGTAIRMVPATTMSPASSIGGPASDKYVPDNIIYQPPAKLDSLTLSGGGFQPSCTAAPTITSTMVGTNVSVSGTWTRALSTKPSTATIKLYKNSALIGTTTCTTGSTWTIAGLTLVAGDTVYAMAQAAGESMCFKSDNIILVGCSIASQTTTTGLGWTCATKRGFSGTRPSGASIRIYLRASTGTTLYADDASTTYLVTYPTATTWYYDGANGNGGSDPCTAGPFDINNGSYSITAQLSGFCESAFVSNCLGLTQTATPTITQTNLYPTNTIVSGTATASSLVNLYINNNLITTMTATAGGSYSFSGLTLLSGDIIRTSAIASGQCISNSATVTVGCITSSLPIITTDNNGYLQIGATIITGTSSEAAGTVVTVYKNAVSIGTTTVQSNGTWSLTYTIVSGNYSVSQQTGTCLASATSSPVSALANSTICPTITGTYNQYSTTVTGTLSGSFTGNLKLYVDSVMIKSTAVTGATTFSFSINNDYSDKIYPGSKIYVTAQEAGKLEGAVCPNNIQTVLCAAPSAPNVTSPSTVNIFVNQNATFNIGNSANGILYVVKDNADIVNKGTSEFGTLGTITLVTDTFYTVGTYQLKIKALDFSGSSCESFIDVTVNVSGTLPISIAAFSGFYKTDRSFLSWVTEHENGTLYYELQRSFDSRNFTSLQQIPVSNNTNSTKLYQATDIVSNNDNIFYRLKIVSFTGQITYTNVIKIKGGNSLKNLVFANPFIDQISAIYYSDKTETISLQLYDMIGKLQVRKNYNVVPGNNFLSLTGLSKISKGNYILSLKDVTGNQIIVEKVQKQ